jgi:hypothetical protein
MWMAHLKLRKKVCFIQRTSVYHAVNTNQLMVCKVKVNVCSEFHTKQVTQCERHAEFLDVKPGGLKSKRHTLKG